MGLSGGFSALVDFVLNIRAKAGGDALVVLLVRVGGGRFGEPFHRLALDAGGNEAVNNVHLVIDGSAVCGILHHAQAGGRKDHPDTEQRRKGDEEEPDRCEKQRV